ncbi:uncharacterized protein LOC121729736 [Aricia agestis]|uniref:uncharacterized protein LOC121729736 n=1 Tax=Aricia agestis TaxID=91739 RepID=UPI001C20192B|nr:uncharacterized protein LOC121729736 [Aricia agestis]
MKKVRFESPLKSYKILEMNETECHFPRPFIERQVSSAPSLPACENFRVVPYNSDPVHRYEYGNSSPFPNVCKMQVDNVTELKSSIAPTSDLELSILDASNSRNHNMSHTPHLVQQKMSSRKPLSEVNKQFSDNTNEGFIPNVLNKTDDFFLRKENLNKINSQDNFYSHLNKLSLNKENSPQTKKMELINKLRHESQIPREKKALSYNQNQIVNCCQLQHQSCRQSSTPPRLYRNQCVQNVSPCCPPNMVKYHSPPCLCQKQTCCSQIPPKSPSKDNFVDKRNWAVEKLDQANKECSSINSLDDNVKREPTVSDLFKIIKMQNEQLQMLQQKVDKLITEKQETKPVTQYITSHVALQAVEEQKMSIGVMTSFEMVRTSTIINKEIVQNEAQIQCNRSQISIKEVVSKTQPKDMNFLDGIPTRNEMKAKGVDVEEGSKNATKDTECGVCDDNKTYNELSLYNVQVDNATTPNMSPEQSLYLDVRDYSDSDSGSDEHSNVGWTYYNQVMTHVNGLLHESDMPSSASALFRNTRQKCLQMQIDKTNVSVAKRVTFGDDPLGMQQQNLNAALTDTSMKMNQLAAKYLKSRPVFTKSPSPKPLTNGPNEMSYATRNYMEKHKLLQGPQAYKPELPKFLDITALKQQPKLV